jgi:UDP-3-O-[3-hydroxymyristoyl] glucosamine N-acyltransferase
MATSGIHFGVLVDQIDLPAVDDQLRSILLYRASALHSALPGSVVFIDKDIPKLHPLLKATQASLLIAPKDFSGACACPVLRVDQPRLVFAKTLQHLYPKIRPESGIHPTAVIGQDCEIHSDVSIGPHCIIGDGTKIAKGVDIAASCTLGANVVIGQDVKLWPRVVILDRVQVGERSEIHSGAVIGCDGFGFVPNEQKKWMPFRQIGSVVIEADVSIGANTTIDCGALGNTLIKKGVIIDNQVQIGHNVVIGENTAIAGCTGIAGSTVIGKNCLIGGASSISGHLNIADQVVLSGQSTVVRSITEPGMYSSFASVMPDRLWKKTLVCLQRLTTWYDKHK